MIDALDVVLCAQLTRDLFAIAKFLFFSAGKLSRDGGAAAAESVRCNCHSTDVIAVDV